MPPRVPAPTPVPQPKQAPTWLRPVILACTALFLLACFTQAAGDSDMYLHLRSGRFIWENHRLAVPDPFSFTTYLGPAPSPAEAQYRYFNLTHEWLWQLMLYLVYAGTGFAGMVLLRGLALSLACALVGRTVYVRTGGFYHGVAASLMVLAVASNSPILDRPGI